MYTSLICYLNLSNTISILQRTLCAFMLNESSDTSDEYAEVKGSLEAIQQNLITKKCGS